MAGFHRLLQSKAMDKKYATDMDILVEILFHTKVGSI